jgi:D-alanyl-D-alanine carboxypeptidase
MADINFETERLSTLMAEVNRQMQDYGQVTKQTQDQLFDAQAQQNLRVKNATAAITSAGSAFGSLAKAGMSAASAMNQGQKGAAAFNGAVDGMADAAKAASIALMLLGGPLGLLAGVVTAAIAGLASYTKAANEMSDSLYKGYQGLAKSGAAASDGMTGLYKDAKKLGLGLNELDSLVSLVGENSADFARFAGSVSEGRKRFAELGEAMKPQREAMIRMGMMPQEINEGMAGYLRTQTRLGNAQSMTTAQLAQGAREYLREQDALTKITGQSVKETEKKREAALMEEQFASKIRQLQLSGQGEAAERLMRLNDAASAVSEEMGRGFRALSTGNLVNADAQKLYLSTQGQALTDVNAVIAGTKSPMEALDSTAKRIGETNDRIGVSLGLLAANDNTFIAVGEARKIQLAQEQGFVKQRAKAEEDYQARLKGGTDPILDSAAKLRDTQIKANEATNDFIVKGIVPATTAMEALATATIKAANLANELTPGGKPREAGTSELVGGVAVGAAGAKAGAVFGGAFGTAIAPGIGTAIGAVLGGLTGAAMGYFTGKVLGKKADETNIPKAAEGGLLTGPESGYMAMLHGTEMVIPADMLKGSMAQGGGAGASGDTKMQDLHKEMLKDTEALAKITDQDLTRSREFTRINLKLIDLKTDLMEDEIELLEEQNKMLADIEKIYTETMGPEAAKIAVKAFKRSNLMGGMGGMGGMPAPAGAGGGPGAASEVEGARAGSDKRAADLLQFTGRSGSASAFEGLNSRLKDSVLAAAEEYHAATGNKMQVNSAKRDSADQHRLWEETVAAGRPGRGPSGMAVARPGHSPHEKGLAIDIQNYTDPRAVAAMNRQGLQQKVPGDPVHFSFADGGIASGPFSGYMAELHGPEAVVPLPDGKTIPVRIEGGDFGGAKSKEDMSAMMNQFKSSMESMINQLNNRDLLNMMDEMVRAQKTSNGIQEKLLRAAAN